MLLAKRFIYHLMDDRAALAACLIAAGASFWADGGAVVVSRDATVFSLSKREAGQVAALLPLRPTQQPQTLMRHSANPRLLEFLQAEAERAHLAMPVRERQFA